MAERLLLCDLPSFYSQVIVLTFHNLQCVTAVYMGCPLPNSIQPRKVLSTSYTYVTVQLHYIHSSAVTLRS